MIEQRGEARQERKDREEPGEFSYYHPPRCSGSLWVGAELPQRSPETTVQPYVDTRVGVQHPLWSAPMATGITPFQVLLREVMSRTWRSPGDPEKTTKQELSVHTQTLR